MLEALREADGRQAFASQRPSVFRPGAANVTATVIRGAAMLRTSGCLFQARCCLHTQFVYQRITEVHNCCLQAHCQ